MALYDADYNSINRSERELFYEFGKDLLYTP
jgi:hypothetical protein